MIKSPFKVTRDQARVTSHITCDLVEFRTPRLRCYNIVPEHFRVGSLTELSQWTMERTIGNLGEEIRLHSDLYTNLSQRVIECARANALYALALDLLWATEKLPASACDIGGNYLLLGPHEHHEMDTTTLSAFQIFLDLHHWKIKHGDSLGVDRFVRLLLPNVLRSNGLKRRLVQYVVFGKNKLKCEC